ncbi:c-type cytochrome [Marinimicrobium locisalis]|uniref:c-type cytochrome n=1 Tax=Marinimicrobium locisalis TaxID=546022 RepID=UPI0032214F77
MKKVLLSLCALGSVFVQPALAQDAEKLFQGKACAACHSMDTKMVGPAIKEIAAKYAGEDDASGILANSIKNGSKGKWGQMPMPANNVTEEEAKALAEWILEKG